MSADGDTVRAALTRLRGDHLPNYADEDSFELAAAALAALARLEAAETAMWHLQGAWDQERAQILAQRDALAAALKLGEAFARDFLSWLENEAPAEEWDGGSIGYDMGGFAAMATEFLAARAALAEAGLE